MKILLTMDGSIRNFIMNESMKMNICVGLRVSKRDLELNVWLVSLDHKRISIKKTVITNAKSVSWNRFAGKIEESKNDNIKLFYGIIKSFNKNKEYNVTDRQKSEVGAITIDEKQITE